MPELRKFKNNEYKELMPFMAPLWEDTYKNIIPEEHIKFLLEKYFLPENTEKFVKDGYEYYYLTDNGEKCGIIVIHPLENEVYLDKLYFAFSARGKGYARFVINELKKYGKDITLNVNRNNFKAYNVYIALGFKIEEKQEIALGNGMVNFDYKMRLKV